MTGRIGQLSGNVVRLFGPLSYYDLALLVLPAPLVAGLLAGAVTGVPLRVGVQVGAVLSSLALGHALFRNPPRSRGRSGSGPDSFSGQSG